MREALKKHLEGLGGEVKGEGGAIEYERVIAERRVFLGKKKLLYRAQFRVDEKGREILFTEMLLEASSGLAPESGLGFKKETYRTGAGPRSGEILEQSKLFGKRYGVDVDFSSVRKELEALARKHGYTLRFQFPGK